ncbi:MAG: S-layer homology domain-containing protein [Oscillospiraceae bacterium]|nr:S-layer homology domain-containing protein [Oscillospiraceae bacterium]
MRKISLKRVLSFVLALSLVVGMLPQFENAFAADDGVVSFSFTKTVAQYGEEKTDWSYWTTADGVAKDNTYVNTRSLTEYYNDGIKVRNWKYFDDTMHNKANASKAGGYLYTASSTYAQGHSTNWNNWIAFKVKGLATGTYTVKMTAADNRGCVIGMYILDNSVYGNADTATITEATDDTLGNGVTKLNEVDLWGNASNNLTYDFGNVNLEGNTETEYIVLFKMERAGELANGETSSATKSEARLHFNTLTFEKIEALKEITATNINAVVGEEIKPEGNLSWIGTSGDACGGEKVIEKIELVDNDVGAVLEGSDGNFYAVAPGEATIKVTGKLQSGEGGSKSVEIKVTVSDNDRIFGGNILHFDFSSTEILKKEAGVAEFEYANAGKTAIFSDSLDYYFKSEDGAYARNWKYFDRTLPNRPWTTGANGTYFDGGSYGNWAAFKVMGIPGGAYNVALNKPANNAKGCVWSLYVLDGTLYGMADAEAITAALDTMSEGVQKVGEVDTYASLESELVFGVADFEGNEDTEHILVFRAVREGIVDEGETKPSNNSGRFISITGITLDGTYVESVDTTIEYTQLGVGEETKVISTTGKKNSGEIISDMSEVGYVNYEIVQGNEVAEIGKDGKSIITKKQGIAVIETTVIADGLIITDRDTIEVDEKFSIESVYVKGVKTAYLGKRFRLVPVIKMGDGSEVVPADAVISYIVDDADAGIVSADGDVLVAGNIVGEADVRISVQSRGKSAESDKFTVKVTDEIEPLSGELLELLLAELAFEGKEDECKAIKFNVPEKGRYQLTLSAEFGKNSGIVDLYAIPYSEDAMKNPERYLFGAYKLDEADLFNTTTATEEIMLEDAVFDEAGEYLLVANIAGKNSSGGGYAAKLQKLVLDGVSVISNVVTEVYSPRLGPGEETELNIFAHLSNGTLITMDEASIAFEYNEEEITADAEKLTVKASEEYTEPKSCEFTVTVTYKGHSAQTIAAVKVDELYGVNPNKTALLYGDDVVSVGNNLNLKPALELNNQSVVETIGCEVEYVVENNEEGVLSLLENNTVVKAVKAGEATVYAKVVFRGREYTTEKKVITVVADALSSANIDINFTKGGHAGDGFTTVDTVLGYTSGRNWVYDSVAGKSTVYSMSMNDTYAQIVFDPTVENKYLALRLKVPSAGVYNITAFSNWCRKRAGRWDMYIFPVTNETSADLPAQLIEKNFVGYMDFYKDSNGEPGEILNVAENYAFTGGGEYYVVLSLANGISAGSAGIRTERGDTVYPTYISFTNVKAMDTVTLTAEKQTLDIGENTAVAIKMYNGSGDELSESPESVIYRTSDNSVATVDINGRVTAISEGKTTIRAIVSYGGVIKTTSVEISVEDSSEILGITLSAENEIYIYGSTPLSAVAQMESENLIDIPYEYIEWTLSDNTVAEISEEDKMLVGKSLGTVTVSAKIKEGYKPGAEEKIIEPITLEVVWDATIDPAIYTIEERENVKKNAERYSWVRDKVKSTTGTADDFLENFDKIYSLAIPEGVPRTYHVGHKYDPQCYNCRYCGKNLGSIYSWDTSPVSKPWKIQCPECKRVFPSNDFASFYELGVSENGLQWNYADALQKHHEMFVCESVKAGNACTCVRPIDSAPVPGSSQWMANDPRNDAWYEFYGYNVNGGYLTNDLYKEMDEKLGVTGWGVDDGFGYRQPYVSDPNLPGYDKSYYEDENGYARYVYGSRMHLNAPIQHMYVGYYLHEGVWFAAGGGDAAKELRDALTAFRDAFLYTGEAKYGRAGAILLDRIADIYPGFDWYQWASWRGDSYRGTIIDPVWGHHLAELFASSYDAFLPIYNDRQVIDTLSKRALYKADENGNYVLDENGEKIPTNLKDTPGAVRLNAEDGICRESFRAVKAAKIVGNFGVRHKTVITAALALNKMPETGEMLDWLMKYGEEYSTGEYKGDIEGGNVARDLINRVDRDGHGDENSPHYNYTWWNNLMEPADMLAGYEKHSAVDLFENPKFLKMITAQLELTLGGYYTPAIGDTLATASTGFSADLSSLLVAYKHTGDRKLAQMIWLMNELQNDGDIEKLRGSIFDEDAEKAVRDIEAVIDEDGMLSLDSEMKTGWGFTALRAGANYDSASESTKTENTRDFAVYFGGTSGHGHFGALDLMISAFGLNLAPDLGYPARTGNDPNRYQWVTTTISHNTVVVNEEQQMSTGVAGTPHHFDDVGKVKLLDVSADVYTETNEYRRAVIMIEANDDVSYAVDFFHVNGGDDHLYSFHSQSDEIVYTEGLGDVYSYPTYAREDGTLVGTYAGPDVVYGDDPGGNAPINVYPLGYTWLKNVRKYNSPEKDFAVEFKVKDWRKVLDSNKDLRLRLTMVNDEPMEEVSFVTGEAPQTEGNKEIGELEYLLVRNEGKNLDTTFTTVFEPYEANKKYIADICKVSMSRDENARPGLYDSYSAVKVTHTNGRVDYVMYSTNNAVDYVIKDGDVEIDFRGFAGVITIGKDKDGKNEVVYSYLNDGEVLKLAEEAESENVRLPAYTGEVVSFTTDFTTENFITIAFDEGQNPAPDDLQGRYVYIDNSGEENGVYRIESAREVADGIEVSLGNVSLIQRYVDEKDIESGYVYNIKIGESFRIPVSYKYDLSPVVEQVEDVTASAGSSVTIAFNATSPNGKSLTFDKSKLPRGMSIDEESQTLTWKPTSSQVGENHVALTVFDGVLETTMHFTVTVYGSTGGNIGGGGAGGGTSGGTTTPTEPSTPTTPDGGETENVRFTDLGNHAWAADAINALADNGIVKGTSATTYSPAANITRADFAILLVRAFEKESDNTENFSDVSESDYFARELAIARNTGLVGGIGDNKFAPRDNIKRCDMMLMVYRVVKDKFVGADIIRPEYPDFDSVPDYAKEAVSVLISEGLVNGKNGKIAPHDFTTRAEVAVLLQRVLEFVAEK